MYPDWILCVNAENILIGYFFADKEKPRRIAGLVLGINQKTI
jgi:hypothetical protein